MYLDGRLLGRVLSYLQERVVASRERQVMLAARMSSAFLNTAIVQ